MARDTASSVSIVVRIPNELADKLTAIEDETNSDRSTVVRTLLGVALDVPQKQIAATETLWLIHSRIKNAVAKSGQEILDLVQKNLQSEDRIQNG